MHRAWRLYHKPWPEKFPFLRKSLTWAGHPDPEYGELYIEHIENAEKDLDENLIRKANEIAKDNYQMKPYPGPIVFFKGEITGKYVYYGWEEMARGGLEIHHVPGHHFNAHLEPAIIQVADVIRRHIDRSAKTILEN